MFCEIHKCEMKLVPAGVSRRTGKPYNAFYACQVRDCQFRPPAPDASQTPPQPQSPRTEANRGQYGKSSEGTIIRQVAFKGAVELVSAGKIALTEIHAWTDRFDRIIQTPALLNPLPPAHEELPTIQVDEPALTDDELPPF